MQLRIHRPIYLLENTTNCWNCGAHARVVALAATKIEERQDSDFEDVSEPDESALLKNLTDLPPSLLKEIRRIQPHFEMRDSRTAGIRYYANFCPACSALFGDYYLHDAGGPFFPVDDDAFGEILVHHIKTERSIELRGEPGWGIAGEIVEKGKHVRV